MFKFDKIKDFWCMKVLPTVYEDSLSYYEVLCKVIKKVNEIIDKIAELPDKIRELIKEEMANYEIPLATRDKIGGIYAEAGTDEDSVPVRIKNGFLFVKNILYTLKQANDTELGGVRASVRVAGDTQPVRIDPETGLLYTAPGTGGGGGGGVDGLYNINDFEGETIEEKIENAQQTLQAGSTVLFPVGEYVFTKPVVLYTRLRFVGLGGILSWERPKFVIALEDVTTVHDEEEYGWDSCFHILVTDFVFENINFSVETALPTTTYIASIFKYNPMYSEDETRSIVIRKSFIQCPALNESSSSATLLVFNDVNAAQLQTVILEDIRIDNYFTTIMDTNVSHVILRRVYFPGWSGYHASNSAMFNLVDVRMVIVEECDWNANIIGSQMNYHPFMICYGLDKTAELNVTNSRMDVSMATSWLGSMFRSSNGTVPVINLIGSQFIFAKNASGTAYYIAESGTNVTVGQPFNVINVIGCIAKGCDPEQVIGLASFCNIVGCIGIGCRTGYAVLEKGETNGEYAASSMLPTITVAGATVNNSKVSFRNGMLSVALNLKLTALTGSVTLENTDYKLCKLEANAYGNIVGAHATYGYEADGVIKGRWWTANVYNQYGADKIEWDCTDTAATEESVMLFFTLPVALKPYFTGV